MVFADRSGSRIEPGLLSPRDLRVLIERLPARERAAIAWTPQSIATALRKLYEEPFSEDLVAEVSAEVFRALRGFWSGIHLLFSERSVLRAELEVFWRKKIEDIRDYIPDAATADGAEWAFRAMVSMFDVAFSIEETSVRQEIEEIDDTLLGEASRDREAGAIMRSQVLLMAILDGAEENLDPARASLLAEWALVEAVDAVKALAKAGIRLDPFRGQTAEERASRILQYADNARSVLTREDVETIEAARIESLR